MTSLFLGGYSYAENIEKQQTNKVAIFYPQAKEPYNSIYQNIIAGSIKAAKKSNQEIYIEKFIIKKNFNVDAIALDLQQKHIDKVIVLGRSGWQLAKQLSNYAIMQLIMKHQNSK